MSEIKLKICGVQNINEAKELVRLGVDYIGLNFVPSSKRRIDLETAQEIVAAVRSSSTQTVLLFQNQSVEFIKNIASELDISLLQLHGSEDYSTYSSLAVGNKIIKVIYPNSDLKQQISNFPSDYYLLDRPNQGNGELVSQDSVKLASSLSSCLFLAGGITPSNLQEVIRNARPYAVDIASGVRTDGALDVAKIELVQAILDRA
ncbi:phosphoribosylanthranilate isomerase [Candidatus Saccharibacteria bacterium]|jgi:phosphoribosylanthranilate isomerase|nr:phosphoribosylanthranilate isomerase [Candidatus Saccharibacteria bacterium]